MKKAVIIIIALIAMSFTINTALSTDFSSNTPMKSTKLVKTSAKMISKDSEITESFREIADLQYDQKKCNCKHKSEAFAGVLTKKGAKNVYLVTIGHKSGKYSHMVVSWEGKIYDATTVPCVYGMPEDKYFKKIEKYGFNGLRVKSPYLGN